MRLTVFPPAHISALFPYTTLFRSVDGYGAGALVASTHPARENHGPPVRVLDGSRPDGRGVRCLDRRAGFRRARSEEHTSELQSHHDLVCRLLLQKKNKQKKN